MKKTDFVFFKNTPLIDFQNTIHFENDFQRDKHFLQDGHYKTLELSDKRFNYIRDKSTLDVSLDYKEFRGVNYCTFKSDFEDTRYYAYVMSYEYIQEGNTRVFLMIDPIMTYTQGTVLEKLSNLKINRQHLTRKTYNAENWQLKNNEDILKSHTKWYFHTEQLLFKDLVVIIQSSADLQADFGTVDDPKIKTSSGKTYDKIVSPLNLYVVEKEKFSALMQKLAPFPWIAQNITSMSLVPRVFVDGNLTKLSFGANESLSGVDYLYSLSGESKKQTFRTALQKHSKTNKELCDLFGLDSMEDIHLLRNEYTTIELYNYSGDQLFIDTGLLDVNKGLSLELDIITGYHTELIIYVAGYKGTGNTYKNDCLSFNEFDDIPMLIDNATLSLSKSANQRKLTESKLVSNRIKNVMNPNADLKDRFFDAASLLSNVSMNGLFGKFSDEHEFYRQQKAEQADLALQTPSISSQTNGNSFNIANDMFGIHIKYSKPAKNELNRIKKYYKMFGFEWDEDNSMLDSVNNMSICNYVQFSGSWTLDDCDVALIEMMKAQFENGVRFWHDNKTKNPMNQNVLNNKMRW